MAKEEVRGRRRKFTDREGRRSRTAREVHGPRRKTFADREGSSRTATEDVRGPRGKTFADGEGKFGDRDGRRSGTARGSSPTATEDVRGRRGRRSRTAREDVHGPQRKDRRPMPTGVAIRDPRGQLFDAAERVLLRDGPGGLTSRAVTME